jgi:acetyl-CoA acetyltransferase
MKDAPAVPAGFDVLTREASSLLWAGIDIKKLNPQGGAITFGHPLGMTLAGQIRTILYGLKRRREDWSDIRVSGHAYRYGCGVGF